MSNSKRLTVSLPVADWENLQAEADAAGVAIGTYGRTILLAHVNPSLFRDESDAALAWIVKNRLVLPDTVPNVRAKITAWAKQNGWQG